MEKITSISGWIQLPQSITFRILTLILTTVLLIIGVLGSYNTHVMRKQIKSDVYQQLISTHQLAIKEVHSLLVNPMRQLEFVAGVLAKLPFDAELSVVMLNRLMGEKKSIQAVAFYSSDGSRLYHFSRTGLSDYANKAGKALPEEVSDSLKGKRSVGLVHFTEYGLPEIDMAVPVLDINKNLQSVLYAHVSLLDMIQYVEQFKQNHSAGVLIYDRSGRLLAHTDSSLVRQQMSLSEQPYAEVDEAPVSNLYEYKNFQKQNVFAVARKDVHSGWTIVVEQQESDAMALLDQTKFSRRVALFAVVIVTLLLGLYILQLITRPLSRLGHAVDQVSNGKQNVELDIPEGNGEVAKLSRAFKLMATRIFKQREALVQEKALFQLLLESVGEGLLGIDVNGNCSFINPAGCKLLGYENDREILGKNSHDLLHHSFLDGTKYPESECPIYAVFSSGEIANIDEDVFWGREGSAVPVKYQAHPMLKDGKIVGVICSFMDMTQARKDELRLKQLARAVEQSPATVLITNAKGIIEYGNKKLVDLTGYELHEVIGRNPGMFSAGETPVEVYESLWSTILSGKEWHGMLRNKKKDGTVFTEEMWVSVITNNAGKITNFVAVKEDVTERQLMQQRIWKQAHYDSLTCLPNRMLFTDRLKHGITQARRNRCELALLFIDLDGFKQVNDTMNHQAGDQLLTMLGERFLECIRESDTAARMGGDEFAVILCDVQRRVMVDQVAKRILDACRKPFDLDEGMANISCSIGISLYPQDGQDDDELQRHADVAMYRVKRMHKDGISYYSTSK